MSILLVLTFTNETGAGGMVGHVQALQKQQLIAISDAAIVIRKEDRKVKVKQVNSLVGVGALGGAFWGLLVGRLFWESWLDPSASAAEGKILNSGIADEFIVNLGRAIQPGCSALFMMIGYMLSDKVLAVLAEHNATLLRTNLNITEEVKLREAFGVVDEI